MRKWRICIKLYEKLCININLCRIQKFNVLNGIVEKVAVKFILLFYFFLFKVVCLHASTNCLFNRKRTRITRRAKKRSTTAFAACFTDRILTLCVCESSFIRTSRYYKYVHIHRFRVFIKFYPFSLRKLCAN